MGGGESPAFLSTRLSCLPLSADAQMGCAPSHKAGLWSREAEGTGAGSPRPCQALLTALTPSLLGGSLEGLVGGASVTGLVDTSAVEQRVWKRSRRPVPGQLTRGPVVGSALRDGPWHIQL